MSKLTSTGYAKDLASRIDADYRDVLTKDEQDKRHQLLNEFKNTNKLISEGHEATVRLYRAVYPVWVAEVDHDSSQELRRWFGNSFTDSFVRNSNPRDFLNSFSSFLFDTRNEDTTHIEAYLHRIDTAISKYKFSTFFFARNFYASSFPVEWLAPFVSNQRYYLGSVIKAFNDGYTPELVKKTHYSVWLACSPSFTEAFIKTHKPTFLKSFVQLGNRGDTEMTDDIVSGLTNAGFADGREVKDYARKFAINFTDDRFYERVIAAKRKYPTLEDYVQEF
jgi:hypothetical protein